MGSSHTGIAVLCPLAIHINLYVVLVQPRKTNPEMIEKLLTGV